MKNPNHLLTILSKTKLRKDKNTKKVFNRVIRGQFDRTKDREEAETLILLAYKYNLPCLDEMLDDLWDIPEYPFLR